MRRDIMCNETKIAEIKDRVYQANRRLPEEGLVKLTWGNVSEIDRKLKIVVIKPSGVPYDELKPEDMVVCDLQGKTIEKPSLKPSSDLLTHLMLYQQFKDISAIVHTHSSHAVAWAQSGREVPVYGTTHADTFYGDIPCTRQLLEAEVQTEYEENTGKVIIECFKEKEICPQAIPGILVFSHGPFTFGATPEKAVENMTVLDEICQLAKATEELNGNTVRTPQYLLDKHYYRKHGKTAYYGQ